ncbi:unnamed protein product [Diabrotica balteata]|uniref:Uncharacterized protein n=1 Tax=Diabrotica balteata TaxID=107213 RepID=A0A9N9T6G5_DIABA|nr:unnamed protein product [Diabrotica balteata]
MPLNTLSANGAQCPTLDDIPLHYITQNLIKTTKNRAKLIPVSKMHMVQTGMTAPFPGAATATPAGFPTQNGEVKPGAEEKPTVTALLPPPTGATAPGAGPPYSPPPPQPPTTVEPPVSIACSPATLAAQAQSQYK